MLFVQQFLQTLLVEALGVGAMAIVLYMYWNVLTKGACKEREV